MWRVRKRREKRPTRRRKRRVEKREGGGECARKKKDTYRRTRRERDVEEREALSSLSVLDPVPISRLVIGADSRTQCYGLNGCEMRTKRFIVDERKCHKLAQSRRKLLRE